MVSAKHWLGSVETLGLSAYFGGLYWSIVTIDHNRILRVVGCLPLFASTNTIVTQTFYNLSELATDRPAPFHRCSHLFYGMTRSQTLGALVSSFETSRQAPNFFVCSLYNCSGLTKSINIVEVVCFISSWKNKILKNFLIENRSTSRSWLWCAWMLFENNCTGFRQRT